MEPLVTTGLLTDTLRRPTAADIARIAPLLAASGSRACDFTVGGLFLWADYFRYRCALVADTLFVMGMVPDDPASCAFWAPVGALPAADAIALIRDYCDHAGIPTRLTAVPEELLPRYASIPGAVVTELTDFADYIYDIQPMATFSGKKLGKKRNHVNRFEAENPGARLLPLTAANRYDAERFYASLAATKDAPSAVYEGLMTRDLLHNFGAYPFEGAVLVTPAHGVVALAVGEVMGDTLHVHVEKINHEVEGAGEAMVRAFNARMLSLHPELRYVNRQDDAGDPGLRQAKESYHPAYLLRKYIVTLP